MAVLRTVFPISSWENRLKVYSTKADTTLFLMCALDYGSSGIGVCITELGNKVDVSLDKVITTVLVYFDLI